MKHLKQFESLSNEDQAKINGETKFGYWDMANGYMPGLLEELEKLKKEAGNQISFSYKYDSYSNFLDIEVMGDEWLNKICEAISNNDGYHEGWGEDVAENFSDDALKISPMRFH